MRIFYCVLILAFAILLKFFYYDSSNPLPNSPLSYLSSFPKPKASPFKIPATNTKLDKVHLQASVRPPPIPSTKVITSYILAVQWPPGVCTGKSTITCKKKWPADFKIHGLWPQPSRGLPKTSNESVGNGTQIADLNKTLKENWPNLEKGMSDIKFWTHEWDRHGNVSNMTLHAYFNKTLYLFENVGKNLKRLLLAKKIEPDPKTTYTLKNITAALEKIYGFNCSIKCIQSNNKSENVEQIQEIRFSFTPDFKRRNTVKDLWLNCSGSDVRFPA